LNEANERRGRRFEDEEEGKERKRKEGEAEIKAVDIEHLCSLSPSAPDYTVYY